MTGNLPWTPTGLSLLEKINDTIQSNGGIEAMYHIVNDEVNSSGIGIEKRNMDQVLATIIRYKMNRRDASEVLGVTQDFYRNMIAEYKDRIAIKHLTESNH